MKARTPCGPNSLAMVWITPPAPVPSDFLSSMPQSSSPRSMTTRVSPGESSSVSSSGWPLAKRAIEKSGRMRDCACLPVQSGSGLRMAGTGRLPVKVSRCITRFIIMSLRRKVSRLVKPREPSRVSCTMPITGLFDWGETTQRATDMISDASARVSMDCITCRFISSPSKSALYGAQTHSLKRKVRHGTTRARCAMMESLCSDGWRLKRTTSPLVRCLSTTSPTLSSAATRRRSPNLSDRLPASVST
mmetsp:Transcript_2264/g.6839  ORF Transcript_2264/g.6839 Transcript_2264/m.6839 type:complete len:247 (-) Transcript_2264:1409-2149(-)